MNEFDLNRKAIEQAQKEAQEYIKKYICTGNKPIEKENGK